MQRVGLAGFLLMAACTFSVLTATAASAHEFIASKTGALEAEQLNSQTFGTAAGLVSCTKLKLEQPSEVTELNSKTQTLKVVYESCTAFGFSAENVHAEYTFNAEGTVTIDKAILIIVPSTGCEVVVSTGTLSKVEYVSITRKEHAGVEEKTSANGITSQGKLGCEYAKESKGTYKGNSFVWLKSGGTLKWE